MAKESKDSKNSLPIGQGGNQGEEVDEEIHFPEDFPLVTKPSKPAFILSMPVGYLNVLHIIFPLPFKRKDLIMKDFMVSKAKKESPLCYSNELSFQSSFPCPTFEFLKISDIFSVQTRSTSVMKQLTRIQELSSLSHKIPGLTTQAHNEQLRLLSQPQDATRHKRVVHIDTETDVNTTDISKVDIASISPTIDESNIYDEYNAAKKETNHVTLPLTKKESSKVASTAATGSASSILSKIYNIRFPLQFYCQNRHLQNMMGQNVQSPILKPIRRSATDLMKTSDDLQIKSVIGNKQMKRSENINRSEDKLLQQVKEGDTGIRRELSTENPKKEKDSSQDIAMLTDRLEQSIQENTTMSTRLLQMEDELAISNQKVATLQERVHKVEKECAQMVKPQWHISQHEITLSQQELANGGWGRIVQANFRNKQVAAKCLHHRNIQQVVHEMDIASKCHHPNLLKYFGASLEGDPIILTELMQTNLNDAIRCHELKDYQIVPLVENIASAISYLHNLSPEPIIHCGISSSNVLLSPDKSKWVVKLSNFESANLLWHTSEQSRAPGNPTYAAPEVSSPHGHSEKVDVYSFGVLLFEICSNQAPSLQLRNEVLPTAAAVWPEPYRHFVSLIVSCTRDNKDERPTMSGVLAEL